MESSGRKLIVEVCNAKNLMPKDGQGTASAYVMADFDGQRHRTKTKHRDLNPQWDEKLEFLVHDTESMASEVLELNIYNDKKTGKRNTFLGKVKIAGTSFVKAGSEELVYYPLEKRSVFSQIKGEIGVKVSYIDEEPPLGDQAPAEQNKSEIPSLAQEEKPPEKEEEMREENSTDKKEEEENKEEQISQSTEAPAAEAQPPKEEPSNKPIPAEIEKGETAPATSPATPVAQQPPPEVENPPIAHAEKHKPSKETTISSKRSDLNDLDLRSLSGDRRSHNAFDLIDRMPFLYVRVVKAKRSDADAGSSIYAKLIIGSHCIKTRSQTVDRDWDQVFAFDKEGLNSTSLEVSVWSEKKDDAGNSRAISQGTVSFDLQEVPKRVPPDSPLAPQWYSLEDSPVTDVMLAVWIGTQADEAFQESWQSDSGGLIPETRAKVYLSPKLWYLRLRVIQTQDLQLGLVPGAKVWSSELYVKAQLGPQVFKTARTATGSSNPTWNEDLVFVAAEPFEPFLVITVEDVSKGQPVGHTKVHVASLERRTDDRTEPRSRWFNLIGKENSSYAGRINVRVCLEGAYHVLDEAAHVTSDVRASAKELAKPPIGLLEVGIRGAADLLPVKTKDGTRGTIDSYVVAKYGPKWVRTRTILDRFNPRWNEQYAWDVYDPCTVLTIGVFDNGRYDRKLGRDVRLGKLRVRLSTLDTNRVYFNTYSLTVLLPGGAMKMGEIELAVRFTCSSWLSLIQAYACPTLPRMHYVRPLTPAQQDILRLTAVHIVANRLARSEPPLCQEVVQFMLDSDAHVWSMRRSKANWFRLVGCLSRAATFVRWLDGVRTWAHPPTTVLVHVLFAAVVICPHLVFPTVFMYAFFILVLRFRYRQRVPPNMDARLSCVEAVGPDELDEEFDGLPTTRSFDQVRVRYDRLRVLSGRAQTLLGDLAAQGERLEALFNWRDPRATGIFVLVCLFASLLFYVVPFRALVLGSGLHYLRHPRFRDDMPSVPINFFRRLPSFADHII